MDCSLPGSSVHGIIQARILEWIATPSSGGSSQPKIFVFYVSCISRQVFFVFFFKLLAPPGKPFLFAIVGGNVS